MTTVPQPGSLGNSYAGTYDAWNRLVKLMNGASTVATYAYDGDTRRTTKTTTFTRHSYYSNGWQCLEERLGGSNCVERQFVWGLRYIDDLITRDIDTSGGSSSSTCAGTNQRFYVMHDYFNVTAIVDTAGAVQERYGYDAFGESRVMDASFGSRSNSLYGWEVRYGAYRWDSESRLYSVRHRYFHSLLGGWLSRDPFVYVDGLNLYAYVQNRSTNSVDVYGTRTDVCASDPVKTAACAAFAASLCAGFVKAVPPKYKPICVPLAAVCIKAANYECCNPGPPPCSDNGRPPVWRNMPPPNYIPPTPPPPMPPVPPWPSCPPPDPGKNDPPPTWTPK
jgi:RHS repeat-associated protein